MQIHTHPTQSIFLSSLDLHTHASYQRLLPEAIAVVCAPHEGPNAYGVFRMTDPPGLEIVLECQDEGAFHPQCVWKKTECRELVRFVNRC